MPGFACVHRGSNRFSGSSRDITSNSNRDRNIGRDGGSECHSGDDSNGGSGCDSNRDSCTDSTRYRNNGGSSVSDCGGPSHSSSIRDSSTDGSRYVTVAVSVVAAACRLCTARRTSA